MANLIINAFAFKEDYAASMQLGGKADTGMLGIYMQNIFVSLVSAKRHNPGDAVMLLANREVPLEYQKLFKEEGIQVQVIAFDTFVMPKQFVWSLAFFKLCALDYAVKCLPYERILLLDADTFTTHSYRDMWQEADHGILLFPVGHSYSHPDRQAIMQAYNGLYQTKGASVVHIGGEYVCGRREMLAGFMQTCEEIYEDVKKSGFALFDHAGDEFILSAAAKKSAGFISAAPYIYRYWTEKFYLISTNTVANPVCIWHLPSEKDTGMLRLYRCYRKHHRFPNVETCAKMTGIAKAKRPLGWYWLMNKISRKYKKMKMRQGGWR